MLVVPSAALKAFAQLAAGNPDLLSDIPAESEEDKPDPDVVQEFYQFGSIVVVVGRYWPNPGPLNRSGMFSKQSFPPSWQ
jgi:hypothetical protein